MRRRSSRVQRRRVAPLAPRPLVRSSPRRVLTPRRAASASALIREALSPTRSVLRLRNRPEKSVAAIQRLARRGVKGTPPKNAPRNARARMRQATMERLARPWRVISPASTKALASSNALKRSEHAPTQFHVEPMTKLDDRLRARLCAERRARRRDLFQAGVAGKGRRLSKGAPGGYHWDVLSLIRC